MSECSRASSRLLAAKRIWPDLCSLNKILIANTFKSEVLSRERALINGNLCQSLHSTRRTNSTFQRHSPHELESLRLTCKKQHLDVVTVHPYQEGIQRTWGWILFSSVVIRFHGRVNSTYSITPVLEITQDRQNKKEQLATMLQY